MDTLSLGERITECRLRKGILQQDLAAALGVAASTVSHWEDDDHRPAFDKLLRLAEFFDVSIDYLLGRTDNYSTLSQLREPYVLNNKNLTIGKINDRLKALDNKKREAIIYSLNLVEEDDDNTFCTVLENYIKLNISERAEIKGFIKGMRSTKS